MWKRWLARLGADYGYTPKQVYELIGLLVASLVLVCIPLLYKAYLLSKPLPALPKIDVVVLADSTDTQTQVNDRYEDSPTYAGTKTLHPFDPNALSEADWQAFGVPQWLAERIGRYRNAGGIFRQAEDVGKIYNFPPALLARLKPYIQIPEKNTETPYKKQNSPSGYNLNNAPPTYPTLDLNTADSAELEALPQLGPATARNIVKYRKLLGGYTQKEQLYELYNQDSIRTAVFLPYLKLYPGEGLILLDINTLARKNKLYHPYLSKASARLITAWVRQHGNLAKPAQLLEHKLLDSVSYTKLLPYLAF